MRIALVVVVVAAAAVSGCTGLPGVSTKPGQARVPPPPTPPRAVIAVNTPTATPARTVRPRIIIDDRAGWPFLLRLLLAPTDVPCRLPDDPFWPTGHALTCFPSISIRPAPVGPTGGGLAEPR